MTVIDRAALERRKVAALERIADALEEQNMAAKRPETMLTTPAVPVPKVEEEIPPVDLIQNPRMAELDDDEVEPLTDED